jgi:hypothetical protein
MPSDANLVLQASVTKTSTFNGAWLDLGATRELFDVLWARIESSAATNASGSNTIAYTLDTSDDNSTVAGAAQFAGSDGNIALSTTAQAPIQYIAFVVLHRYVRLTCTVSGAGSTPTVTYQAEVVLARP